MMLVLLDLALRAGILAIIIAVIVRATRLRSPAGRHLAWTVVLIGMLSLPLWAACGPRIRIPLPSSTPTVQMPMAWAPRESTIRQDASRATLSFNTVDSADSGRQPISWDTLALMLYGAGVVVLLGRLALGTIRIRRFLRRTVPRDGYLVSAACAAPITVGWLRPVVLVPAGYEQWSAGQLDAVLTHEHEHARRRDPLVQWLALLNRAVFWFHPLAWWLERRLGTLAEEACDAAVLSRGHAPRKYAEYLIDIARAVAGSGGRLHVVGTALPGTSMSARIRQILHEGPRRADSSVRLVAAFVLCGCSSIVIAAGTLTPDSARVSAAAFNAQGDTQPPGRALPEFWLDDDEWHLEVGALMTTAEAAAYAQLTTVSERESFIANFWQRRDTTPATPDNEFRREFERRITYARQNLGNPPSYAVPGYETDRGRFYVSWGPADAIDVSGPAEEWRYRFVPAMGAAVTLRFEPSADFACSIRGGRYRILSPAPRARFEGTASGSVSRPVALTYPGRFVHVSFPIHGDATSIRFGMRAQSGTETAFGEVRGPIDYIQGAVLETRRGGAAEPLLALLARSGSVRFFEPGSFACTDAVACRHLHAVRRNHALQWHAAH